MGAYKVIDATSGSFNYSTKASGGEKFEFQIQGTPNANIKLFIKDKQNSDQSYLLLKVYCADWNGASVEIKCKFDHPEDIFSSTGTTDIMTKDDMFVFKY